MLVINRVELPLLHQLHQVGKLHRHQPRRLEEDPDAADEVVQIGHVRQDVVADQQVRTASLGLELFRDVGAEELADRRNALGNGRGRGIRRRLDAEHRKLLLPEVLQQVAVVGRELDDAGVRLQPEPIDHHLDVGPGVGQPGRRGG